MTHTWLRRSSKHRAVWTAPDNYSSMDLPEASIPPSACVGLEGLDVRAKRVHVFRLVPLWSVRLPQPFGHSGGHQQRVSLGETLLSQLKVALWSTNSSLPFATAQLEIMPRVLSSYPRQEPFLHVLRVSRALLTSKKTCYVPAMNDKALLSGWSVRT